MKFVQLTEEGEVAEDGDTAIPSTVVMERVRSRGTSLGLIHGHYVYRRRTQLLSHCRGKYIVFPATVVKTPEGKDAVFVLAWRGAIDDWVPVLAKLECGWNHKYLFAFGSS